MGCEMSKHPNDDDYSSPPPKNSPLRDSQNTKTNSPFIQQVQPQSPSPSTNRPCTNAQQISPTSSASTISSPNISSASSAFSSLRSSQVNSGTSRHAAGANSRTEDPFSFLLTWSPFNWSHHPAAYQMFDDPRLLRAYLNRTGFREGRPIANSNLATQKSIGTQVSSRSRNPGPESESYAQLCGKQSTFYGRSPNQSSNRRSSGTGSSVFRTLYDEDEEDCDGYVDDADAVYSIAPVHDGHKQGSPQGQSNGTDRGSSSPGEHGQTEASKSQPQRPLSLCESIHQAIQSRLQSLLNFKVEAQRSRSQTQALQSQLGNAKSQIAPSKVQVPYSQTQVTKQKSRPSQLKEPKSQPHISQTQLKALKSQPRQSSSSSTVVKSNLFNSTSIPERFIFSSSRASSQASGTATGASSNTSVVTAYGSALGPVNSGTDARREQGSLSKQNLGAGPNSGSNQPPNATTASRSASSSPRDPQDPSSLSGRSGSSSAERDNS